MKSAWNSESKSANNRKEFNASPPLQSGVYLGFFVPGHHAVMKRVSTERDGESNNVIAREVRFLLETEEGD